MAVRFFGKIKEIFLILVYGKTKYLRNRLLNCGVNFGEGCIFPTDVDFGSEPYLITIQDNVRISSNVRFVTHDGAVHTIVCNSGGGTHKYGKIIIGRNSFIGANVIILPNVYIGENCIIGAGSVVAKSIPDNTVAAGVPAKAIKSFEEYSSQVRKGMPKEWDDKKYRENTKDYLIRVIKNPQKPQKKEGNRT